MSRPEVNQRYPYAIPFIAIGLVMLLLSTWWPAMPVVLAVALVGLGATETVAMRWRGSPWHKLLIAGNGLIYLGITLLMAGAIVDRSVAQNAGSLSLPVILDLVAAGGLFVLLGREMAAVFEAWAGDGRAR